MGIHANTSARFLILFFLLLDFMCVLHGQDKLSLPLRLHDGVLRINTVMPRLPLADPGLLARYQVWYSFDGDDKKDNLAWTRSVEGEFFRDAIQTVKGLIHLRLTDLDGNIEGEYVWPYQVDNSIPPKPVITGLNQGGIYQSAPKVEISFPAGFSCDYRLVLVRGIEVLKKGGTESGQEIHFDSAWTSYEGTIVFPSLDNMEVHGYLGYRLSSQSGLSREENIALEFSVDTKPPHIDKIYLPESPGENLLNQVSGNMELSKTTMLRVESADANGFTCQWDDQTVPLETNSSNSWIKITVEEKRDAVRKIWIQAHDGAGNRSDKIFLTFHLDGIPPDPPPFPEISRNLNSGKITFPAVRMNHIYYQIISDPDAQADFLEATGPIDWTIPDSVQGLILRYENRDAAGNRTPGDSIFLPYIKVAKKPGLNIPEGESYWPQAVQIKALDSQDTIRYSVAPENETPQAVDRTSRILDANGIVLDAPPGEEKTYRLRFKRFVEGSESSADFEARVHIDRSIPKEPEFPGFSPVNYLNQPLDAGFRPVTDEAVIYRIDQCTAVSQDSDDVSLLKDWQIIYPEKTFDQSIKLDAGTSAANQVYRLVAWTKDRAGNMSPRKTWIFVFEPSNIYVDASVTVPDEQQSGTRSHPYSNLVSAIQGLQEGEKHILLASGNYSVNQTLLLGKNLKISGQRDPVTWKPVKGLVTVLYPARNFDGQWLIDANGPNLVLDSLYISDAGKSMAGLLHSDGAEIQLLNSQLAVTRSRAALVISGGSLDASDCLVFMSDPKAVKLIQLEKTRGTFRSCQIESSNLPDTLAKNAGIGEYTLVSASDSRLEFENTVLYLCRGYSSMGLDIMGGTLQGKGLKINEVKGSAYATLLRAQGGAKLVLENCRMGMGGESGLGTAFQIMDSDLSISASNFSLSVRKSALGFKTYRSRLSIDNTDILMDGAQDFLGLFKLEDSSLAVSGSRFKLGHSASLSFVSAQDSDTDWKENTLVFSAASKSGAFQFFGEGKQYFSRNLISGDQISVLMSTDSDTVLEMRGNILESWYALLSFNTSGTPGKETLVRNLKELEALKGDSIFEGNRVRQGL